MNKDALSLRGIAPVVSAVSLLLTLGAAVQAQSGGGPAGSSAMNGSPGGSAPGPVARGGVPSPATHRVMVNGRPVDGDVAPQDVNGRLMMPVRFVTEYLGGRVDWQPTTRTVAMRKGTQDIKMTIGSRQAYVNKEGRELSIAPTIIAGRTLIPLREVSRLLGAVVDYNDRSQVVFVSTPAGSVEPPSRTHFGAMMAHP